ncbi:uncharacterized protein K460DRAFT_393007 [Cucurbitaria berberidis CBS 394.84]|uniref:Uncharacterized protein n=1 Tax=Cucurbitaria berberidis CBS 394.84 TaxID=1168544 RepID=A0A9P4GM48_9PLEO|nr:uncharacterized protein K460DRAFT_393007 [Cucurbitaria berberidis CBS 394.84]KAF1847737.1 hypothetical protein K460DRAFT_393007 [Cucurbitaria berberidis CBS 394.84]
MSTLNGSRTSSPPGSLPPPLSLRESVTSPTQPVDPDAITPAPPPAGSSASLLSSSSLPSSTPLPSSSPLPERPHAPTPRAAQLAYVSTAVAAPSRSITAWLENSWDHPIGYTMPPRGVLFKTFVPLVAAFILHSPRGRRCFCALALEAAQAHVNRTSHINLWNTPENLADFFATLNQFFTSPTVNVFAVACERHEELYGPGSAEPYIQQYTIAEHVSDFLEQIARDGAVIIVGAEDDAARVERQQFMSGATAKPSWWKRVKASFQKAKEKLQVKTNQLRHDSVLSPRRQLRQQRRRFSVTRSQSGDSRTPFAKMGP